MECGAVEAEAVGGGWESRWWGPWDDWPEPGEVRNRRIEKIAGVSQEPGFGNDGGRRAN